MSEDADRGELETGQEFFDALPGFAELRRGELLDQLGHVRELFDDYGRLACRATLSAGRYAPRDEQEVVVRDLMADVFDFLHEAQRPLFEGRVHVTFPLARRAYESLSLMSLCYQDAELAKRWHSGAQIGNAEIRKKLAKAPFPEAEPHLQELYAFYSRGTHPNRELIGHRFLGDGNDFVLGSIGRPALVLVVDECMRLLGMWFWFGALVSHVCQESLGADDPTFGQDYLSTAKRAEEMLESLTADFNRLLRERQEELRAEGLI